MKLAVQALHPKDMSDRDWCLMRQDDNGNRYVVARALTHREAELLSASYTARGHKQLYWIEPMASEPGPATRR